MVYDFALVLNGNIIVFLFSGNSSIFFLNANVIILLNANMVFLLDMRNVFFFVKWRSVLVNVFVMGDIFDFFGRQIILP